jgi:hypothetical protein
LDLRNENIVCEAEDSAEVIHRAGKWDPGYRRRRASSLLFIFPVEVSGGRSSGWGVASVIRWPPTTLEEGGLGKPGGGGRLREWRNEAVGMPPAAKGQGISGGSGLGWGSSRV